MILGIGSDITDARRIARIRVEMVEQARAVEHSARLRAPDREEQALALAELLELVLAEVRAHLA